MQFAVGFAVTPEANARYEHHLSKIDFEKTYQARELVDRRYETYYHSKGWFFSCDEVCTSNYAHLQAAQAQLSEVEAQDYAKLSDARAEVGIFSEYGVAEARDMFWDKFEDGKNFAKRMTTYDAIGAGLTMSRDESLVSVGVRILMST